nr:putative ribonuclease h protein [Quercus suber]
MTGQVSVLIDKERSCWIEDAIDNNFLPHEANLIKSIPLCFSAAKDQLYWPGRVDGVYSVKAGYRFLIEDERTPNADPLPPSQAENPWKELWKLRIPNRTKTLMWRAISDALPSRLNLMKRKVLNEATCQVCGLEPESSMHALWLCPNLAVVWDAHFGTLRNETKDCTNLLDVFRVGLENGHPSDLVAMVTSLIWQRRNKLRIGEPVSDLRLLYSAAREALQEFQHAHTPASHSAPSRIHSKWEPPPSDWVKINFDGAVFQSKDYASWQSSVTQDATL